MIGTRHLYVLDSENRVQSTSDIHQWGQFMEDRERRRVASTRIGPIWISTVFLGVDHAFLDSELHIFETMVFGGPFDQYIERTGSWNDALITHHEGKRKKVLAHTSPWPYIKWEWAEFQEVFSNYFKEERFL